MKVVRGFDDPSAFRGGFVSIGNFDGVHRGHRAMVGALIRSARQQDVPSVVFTFDPHPITVLRPQQAPPPLTTTERKLALFEQLGLDAVIVYPTDRALLDLSAAEFFHEVVRGKLSARGLVEGPNFYFGHDRLGNINSLQAFCDEVGIALEIIQPVIHHGQLVSSTEIRGLVLAGRVAEAGELLSEPYCVHGMVVHGAERGRTIGFPTANLDGIKTVLPPDGVYAGRCTHLGKVYPVGINIGPNPTFGESARKFEAHLDGFSGDLYGQKLEIEFLDRLRGTCPFAGVAALQEQLRQDMEQARTLVLARRPASD